MLRWRCLEDMSWRYLEDILETSWRCMTKTNILVLTKMSWKRLQDVFWRWDEYIRLNQDVLKTYSEDEDEIRLQDIFKTSSLRRMFAGRVHDFCRKCFVLILWRSFYVLKLPWMNTKTYYLKCAKKRWRNLESQNNWKPKMTRKSCGILKLKLNVG